MSGVNCALKLERANQVDRLRGSLKGMSNEIKLGLAAGTGGRATWEPGSLEPSVLGPWRGGVSAVEPAQAISVVDSS